MKLNSKGDCEDLGPLYIAVTQVCQVTRTYTGQHEPIGKALPAEGQLQYRQRVYQKKGSYITQSWREIPG